MLDGKMLREMSRQVECPKEIGYLRESSLVPFAGINLIRFNGSRINGLSPMALRQVEAL